MGKGKADGKAAIFVGVRIRPLLGHDKVKQEVVKNMDGHMLVALDPATGRATKWVVGVDPLLRGPPHSGAGARGEVLNSIAYDPASGRLWVTGKDWARLFEVRLAEQSAIGIRSSRHLFDRRCVVR